MNRAIKKLISMILTAVLVLSALPALALGGDVGISEISSSAAGRLESLDVENENMTVEAGIPQENSDSPDKDEKNTSADHGGDTVNGETGSAANSSNSGEDSVSGDNENSTATEGSEAPGEESENAAIAFEQSAVVDDVIVSVTAPEGVFPAGSQLLVVTIEEAGEIERIEAAIQESIAQESRNKAIIGTRSFDITVVDGDGREIQPDTSKGEVSVAFQNVETTYEGMVEKTLEVFHITTVEPESAQHGGGPELSAEPVETVVDTEAQEVTAQAESFSIYTLTETATSLPTAPYTQLTSGVVYTAPTGSGTTSITATISGQSGLLIPENSNVVIYIPVNHTLSVTGGPASTGTAILPAEDATVGVGAGAGIYLPSGATLIVAGEGTLNATGGRGANGGTGGTGYTPYSNGNYIYRGGGSEKGHGGAGGGGAGAGIGGNGGTGGLAGLNTEFMSSTATNSNGRDGCAPGGAGGSGTAMLGTLYILEAVTVNAKGGASGSAGGAGSGGSQRVLIASGNTACAA
ncbi:hypothetical protein LJC56_11630, partial [Christensenellaceae bacterium OttesenSCG-928-K19]|nr:hypothetical protein [Christensenellaceae bacterium OttesenSCG-928-K19]